VYGVGKIADIFLQRGIREHVKSKDNDDGMQKTMQAMRKQPDGLIFVNLVDFDQLFGQRNDGNGYAQALEAFDRWLSGLQLQGGDLVVLTADHGCDPTTPSTDHSREYTPLLVYGPSVRAGVNLGRRETLADIGQTIADNFETDVIAGTSFLEEIQKGK
jgi:phosphopentomutase